MLKVILTLLCLPTLAFASDWIEAHKPIDCGPFQEIVSIVTQKGVEEEVAWIGQAENNSNVALFLNPKTSTWTLVQYNKEVSCVLEMGKSSKTYKPKNNLNYKN